MTAMDIPYSPIVEREPLRWPGDARMALWIIPNIEHYQYLPPGPGRQNPYPRMPHPDVGAYGVREYGNRVGFWRMMPLLDKFGVRPTLSLNVGCYEHFPDIRTYCEERQFDIMCHGRFNTDLMVDMSAEQQRGYIASCQTDFQRLTGRRFSGWFSPANSATAETPSLAADAGLSYFVDWFHDDQPTLVADDRIVSLPYSMDLNDGWNFRFAMDSEDFVRAAIDQFEQLYSDSETHGRVMSLPLHPFVFGQPHRIAHLERMLDHMMSKSGVWHATGSEIAAYYQRHVAGSSK